MSSFVGLSQGQDELREARQSVELIFENPATRRVGSINFDAILSRDTTISYEIPEHPVDRGANISDHKRRLPDNVVMVGVVSQHNLERVASAQPGSPIEGDASPVDDRPTSALNKLIELADSDQLVTLVTRYSRIGDLSIATMTYPEDAENSDALEVTITFRTLRRATVRRGRVPVSVTNPSRKKKGTSGAKAASDASKEKSQSLFARGFSAVADYAKGAF